MLWLQDTEEFKLEEIWKLPPCWLASKVSEAAMWAALENTGVEHTVVVLSCGWLCCLPDHSLASCNHSVAVILLLCGNQYLRIADKREFTWAR